MALTMPIATLIAFGRQWAAVKFSHIASRWYMGSRTPPCSRQRLRDAVAEVPDAADREVPEAGGRG